MAEERRPYSRGDYNRALIGNALLDPFAVVLLAGMMIAGLVLGSLALMLLAPLLYAAAAGRTYLDGEVADRVLERERDKRRKVLQGGEGRVDPRTLAPPIGGLLSGALQREERIRDAIEGAQLPYTEVLDEVDRFVRAMEGTARRAQLLYEALAESPPATVEALIGQVKVLRRMERQLQAFYDQMEKILVELDTVRGNLVSVSASTDAAGQQQLAAEVRGLREEVGALADGMSEAYEKP